MSEEINWQERYDHLVESLPKSKRPFSDKQAQKVIASQVKRITQLEDDLSFVRCELDKLRKSSFAMIDALVIARDEFYHLNGAGTCPLEIEDILDEERKKNAWHGVDTESFVDGVRTGELDTKNPASGS